MEVKEIISWDEYPIIGFSMAMMLALLGVCKDNSYLMVIALAFFLLAGIKENLKTFLEFIKHHYNITGLAILYFVYYTVFKSEPDSRFFAPAFYFWLSVLFLFYLAVMSWNGFSIFRLSSVQEDWYSLPDY